MEKKAYILIGRSGCGKGTQSKLLIEQLEKQNRKVFSVETGSKFREFIKGDTYSSKLAKEIGDRGELQPMFLALSLWATDLISNMKGDEDLLLDGMPRKKDQADVLHSVFGFYGYEKPKVIYVNVSREWSEARLLARGRGDDEVEKIKRRMDWFETDVMPVVDFYRDHREYDFLDINGEQTIEEVHQEIMDNLSRTSKAESL